MIIKYPDSDRALRNLWGIFEFVERKLKDCKNNHHNTITILYISSYVISPDISYRGYRLLDKLKDIVNILPKGVICLIRTTTPYYFYRVPKLKKQQRRAIDFLRDKCYVVMYTPRREFLNHAKFLIYYHICFSEKKIYSGRYYGSTNLTMMGLSGNSSRLGNYEEYYYKESEQKSNFSRGDRFYINEIYELILHKVKLYTDINYLRNYFSGHFEQLEDILQQIDRVVSGTTIGELFEVYVNFNVIHNQTFALLSQAPGKKLTQELIEKLEKEVKPPEDPLMLELIAPYDREQAEIIAKNLEFDKDELRSTLIDLKSKLRNTRRLIEERYLEKMSDKNDIEKYADDIELSFIEFIGNYYESHLNNLKRLRRKEIFAPR